MIVTLTRRDKSTLILGMVKSVNCNLFTIVVTPEEGKDAIFVKEGDEWVMKDANNGDRFIMFDVEEV